MTTNPFIQHSSLVSFAQKVIDYIGEIKNSEINGVSLHRLRASFEILVEASNSKLLRTFPVKIVDKPIDKIELDVRSTYYPRLKFSEVPNFVIDGLNHAEKLSNDTRCLDAICVLINYCNVIVYSRFDRCLKIVGKQLDYYGIPTSDLEIFQDA